MFLRGVCRREVSFQASYNHWGVCLNALARWSWLMTISMWKLCNIFCFHQKFLPLIYWLYLLDVYFSAFPLLYLLNIIKGLFRNNKRWEGRVWTSFAAVDRRKCQLWKFDQMVSQFSSFLSSLTSLSLLEHRLESLVIIINGKSPPTQPRVHLTPSHALEHTSLSLQCARKIINTIKLYFLLN